jgi:isochorismate synthase
VTVNTGVIVEHFRELRESGATPWMLWRSPEDEVLLAAGAERVYMPARNEAWRAWMSRLHADDEQRPLHFFLAFDPHAPAKGVWEGMPRAWAFVPRSSQRYHLDRQDREQPLKDSSDTTPSSALLRDTSYEEVVRAGLRVLHSGEVEKIVLARSVLLQADIDIDATVRRMLGIDGSFTIIFSPDGERMFLSLTPERLLSLRGGRVRSVALAGTALRGSDDESVCREALKMSPKEAEEHNYVVRMITSQLSPVCSGLRVGEREVLQLRHVFHLKTAVEGELEPSVSFADLVARLHPTPAVAGMLMEPAMRHIESIERFDRGLFAGVAGWMSANGEGDAAVTIRSAVSAFGRVAVFAGAGIVRDSDPGAEHEETSAKLRMVLEALEMK